MKTDKIKKIFQRPNAKMIAIGVVVGLLVLFSIIYSAAILIFRHGKVKVAVFVAPRSATLTLNGTPIKNHKYIYIEPGTYHLEATRDHFETLTMDFQVSKEVPYIAATMTPRDQEGQDYLEKNPAEFRKVEGFVGILLQKTGELEREKYPIIKYLPINNRFYSISYSYPEYKDAVSDTGAPVILVKTDSSYLDVAVAKLKSFEGVNLIDYEINFNLEERFNNPVKSTSSDPEKFLKESYANSGFELTSFNNLADDYAVGIFTVRDKYSLLPSAKHLALIHKEEGNWKTVSTPKPLLTKFNTPNTPDDILNSANSFAGQ